MAHHRFSRLGCVVALAALVCATPLQAAPAPADPIPAATARAVVRQTIDLVEAEGLYPRKQEEYAAAKAKLMAALEQAGDPVDRQVLFGHVTSLLRTLDADGHSFILTASSTRQFEQHVAATRSVASSFALVPTAHGQVLHWTPPQSVADMKVDAPLFLQRFHADYAATANAEQACALVVDLSAQLGGNAWPPLIAMHPLFSVGNPAAWVMRDGQRVAFVKPPELRVMQTQYGGGTDNPLQRFSGAPFGVVVGKGTSSAGEMLLIALLGERTRARTFGQTSYGMTTANKTHQLADGSVLLLTSTRYAIGDDPIIRGGIAPQVPAEEGQSAAETVRQAAEWAAQNAPLCSAKRAL